MGNRAVIVSYGTNKSNASEKLGIYVHWHGSESTIREMLDECKRRGVRPVDYDSQYSWARICQCMADMISDEYGDSADKYSTGIGIDIVSRLDCANGDNGVYYIDGNWNIVKHTDGYEFEQRG